MILFYSYSKTSRRGQKITQFCYRKEIKVEIDHSKKQTRKVLFFGSLLWFIFIPNFCSELMSSTNYMPLKIQQDIFIMVQFLFIIWMKIMVLSTVHFLLLFFFLHKLVIFTYFTSNGLLHNLDIFIKNIWYHLKLPLRDVILVENAIKLRYMFEEHEIISYLSKIELIWTRTKHLLWSLNDQLYRSQ